MHIVCLLCNNRVLRHLALYKVKVLLVLSPAIGLVAIGVHSGSPLRDEVVAVMVQEVSNSAI
jgi:hypothetical protein